MRKTELVNSPDTIDKTFLGRKVDTHGYVRHTGTTPVKEVKLDPMGGLPLTANYVIDAYTLFPNTRCEGDGISVRRKRFPDVVGEEPPLYAYEPVWVKGRIRKGKQQGAIELFVPYNGMGSFPEEPGANYKPET